MEEIKNYYDSLAPSYDENRFGNSYGQFIDQEERALLEPFLTNKKVIDLACGTGRFMDYCTKGVDISAEMIKVAQQKYPTKDFQVADLLGEQPLAGNFDAAICFHLLMHLESAAIHKVLEQAAAVLPKGGLFIFDIPSKERRDKLGYQSTNWHGANSYDETTILQAYQQNWSLVKERGILFVPIHRVPKTFRPMMLGLDQWFNRSFLKKYASYRIYVLQKK